MGLFKTFCFLIITVAALVYPSAIILTNIDDEAHELARISLYISVAIAKLTPVLLFFLVAYR